MWCVQNQQGQSPGALSPGLAQEPQDVSSLTAFAMAKSSPYNKEVDISAFQRSTFATWEYFVFKAF